MSGVDQGGMPKIGDGSTFEGPRENTVRKESIPRKSSTEITLEEMSQEGAETVAEAVRPRTPAEKEEDYKNALEAEGLELEEALSIMEQVVLNGYYEESQRIGPTLIVLRTRLYRDTQRVYEVLEGKQLSTPAAIQDLVNKHNLAGSLVSIGERKFSHVSDPLEASDAELDAAFDTRLAALPRIPDFLTARMMELVFAFDKKMRVIFAEGAPQNF